MKIKISYEDMSNEKLDKVSADIVKDDLDLELIGTHYHYVCDDGYKTAPTWCPTGDMNQITDYILMKLKLLKAEIITDDALTRYEIKIVIPIPDQESDFKSGYKIIAHEVCENPDLAKIKKTILVAAIKAYEALK